MKRADPHARVQRTSLYNFTPVENVRVESSGFEFVRWTLLLADFEYFRQRVWMSKTILEDYVKNVKVDSDVQELEKKLRDVAAELTRTGLYRRIFIRLGD